MGFEVDVSIAQQDEDKTYEVNQKDRCWKDPLGVVTGNQIFKDTDTIIAVKMDGRTRYT